MGQISETINAEFVIWCSSELSFEKRSNPCPGFLSRCEIEMPNGWGEPFFSFAPQAESEIGKCCSVIPVIRNLTFINSGNELLRSDSVLRFFSKKFWNFHDFLLQCDIRVGQDLLSQLGSCILSCGVDDNVLGDVLGDDTLTAGNRVWLICCSVLFLL